MKIGIVHYVNSRPLAWGLLHPPRPAGIDPVLLPPAKVADGLASGALDVGLVPSIELARIPGLVVVPDLAIAATHEVRSVLLVSFWLSAALGALSGTCSVGDLLEVGLAARPDGGGEPYDRGQLVSTLKATPQATLGDVPDSPGRHATCTLKCRRSPVSRPSLTV